MNNNLLKVNEIIEEIRKTTSTNEKQLILKNNYNLPLLKEVLEFTYNPYKKYGISEKIIQKWDNKVNLKEVSKDDIFSLLERVSKQNINDMIRKELVSFIKFENENLRELYKGIILKDLKIGMNIKTINKVFKNLIPEFKVQLAIPLKDTKIENEYFWLTEKYDGVRGVCFVDKNNIKFFSRKGQEINGLLDITNEMENFIKENNIRKPFVFDGELLKINKDNLNSIDLYKETVSIINSKIEDKKDIQFIIFDNLPLEEFIDGQSINKYSIRREMLDNFKDNNLIKIAPVLYQGNDISKINLFINEYDKKGKEGLMLNLDDVYKTKRNKSLIKCKKDFKRIDVLVKDLQEGTGKYSNMLGNIIIEFEYMDKKYTCEVGSGFSDDERIKYWIDKDLLLNKIVEIQYFETTKNKDGRISLRFPTWLGIIRFDKDEISMN